jgi:2-phosphoglycerate kinase
MVDRAWTGDDKAQHDVLEAILSRFDAYYPDPEKRMIDGRMQWAAVAKGVNANASCPTGNGEDVFFEGVYLGPNLMDDGIVVKPIRIISEDDYR